eukprot:s1994_g5.t1
MQHETCRQAEVAEVEVDLPHAGEYPANPHAPPRAYSPAEVARSSSTPSPSGGVTLSSEDGAQLIGRMVLIQGLVRSPEFNGQWGHVESFDPQMQRFMVSVVLPTQLPGETPLYAKLRMGCPQCPETIGGFERALMRHQRDCHETCLRHGKQQQAIKEYLRPKWAN